MALTPEYEASLELTVSRIVINSYEALTGKLWWDQVATTRPSSNRKEQLWWLLETACIEKEIAPGVVEFEELAAMYTEYENEFAGKGLELPESEFEDLDGRGLNFSSEWARQIGAWAAYWPQQLVAQAIRDGGTAYDSVTYYSDSHPIDPFVPSGTKYSNLWAGKPIHGQGSGAVNLDTALNNLNDVLASIASIPLANGKAPRGLQGYRLMGPPAQTRRLVELSAAKFTGSAVGSAAASTDIEAVIRAIGLEAPIIAPELGSTYGGSDTAIYVLAKPPTGLGELGALLYSVRDPFQVTFAGPNSGGSTLARTRKLQWVTRGRNTVKLGHPYALHKLTA